MKLDKFLKVYKFIFLVVYLIINALFTYILIDDIKISNDPSQSFAGLGFALVVVVFGMFINGFLSLVNLVLFIISLVNKTSLNKKKNLILTTSLFILPIVTELILILVGSIFF